MYCGGAAAVRRDSTVSVQAPCVNVAAIVGAVAIGVGVGGVSVQIETGAPASEGLAEVHTAIGSPASPSVVVASRSDEASPPGVGLVVDGGVVVDGVPVSGLSVEALCEVSSPQARTIAPATSEVVKKKREARMSSTIAARSAPYDKKNPEGP